MASPPASQVSIDDILEYTSNNELLTPEEQAQQLRELEEPVPADLADQLFTPEVPAPVVNPFVGQVPNTHLYAISKAELSSRAGLQYVPLLLPTRAMLAAAASPAVSELIPQDHPEWQNLRSGKVTGSSLAEVLGLFEPLAGRALVQAGVHSKMRDHAKLLAKVASLQNPRQTPAGVDPLTQVYFDWGHRHEACGIISYVKAHRQCTVHEVGFVLLDPSLQTLPAEVRQGIDPATLPVIGSSPDGIITEHATAVSNRPHGHWRRYPSSMRRVLEIKAKTPFRPNTGLGTWTWLGKKCTPYTRILPQYFAQAQLNMLVTDSASCHLLCYTVRGGSVEFTIPLHKAWCNQMLHWLSELNTRYVAKGLAPPENVFWDQDAYRAFVALTKEACQSLDMSGVAVQSHHGAQSSPLFCAVSSEDVVPNTPETDQASQQQHSLHQQQQQQVQQPPGWQLLPELQQHQQQQQQLLPQLQQHLPQQQQQQQQQHNQQTAVAVQAAHPSLAQAMPGSVASLQLLSAAAIPLPDQDTDMPDAGPEPQDPLQQPQQHESSEPIGHHRLASWMQHMLHKHCVDLRNQLDSTCQYALSLLATSVVVNALERIAQDVKDGWPYNPSALVMQRIRQFRTPRQPVTCPGAAANGPGTSAASPKSAPHNPVAGAGAGAAASRAVPNGPGPGAAGHGADARNPGAVPASPQAQGHVPTAAAPVHAQSPVLNHAVHHSSHHTSAQRQLWPDQAIDSAQTPVPLGLVAGSSAAAPIDLDTVPNTPSQADTGEANAASLHATTSDAAAPGAVAHAAALSPAPAVRAANCPAPGSSTDMAASADAMFGSMPFPANMTENVRQRLLEVTAMHPLHLKPDDFDRTILIRLAHMPEWKAFKVLQRVADTYWPGIENNTRFLMSICHNIH